MPTDIKTGVGRIVWGHPSKAVQKKDQKGNIVTKNGQPVMVYQFGLAIPKAEFGPIWAAMLAEAQTLFGANVQQMPNFSWKYKDGDGVDRQGRPYREREGYAGCYVLNFSTEAFCPPVVAVNAQGNAYDSVPEDGIKTGDYAVVAVRFAANKPQDVTHTPGLYVNPQMIQRVGYGTAIVNGPDAMTLLGGPTQYALPPGATATPQAPANAPGMPLPAQPGQPPAPAAPGYPGAPQPGGMPGMPQPGGMPGMPQPGGMPGMPQPGAAGYPAPPAPGTYPPAPDFVPNAMGQPPAPAAPGYPGAPQPGYPPMPGMPGN